MRGEFGDVRVLAKLPPTLCNGGTTLGDQQAHVSLLHPAEECPQLDDVEGGELGDDLACVAWPNSLHPV